MAKGQQQQPPCRRSRCLTVGKMENEDAVHVLKLLDLGKEAG